MRILPRRLTPSPVLASPLLSGPGRNAREGWQDPLQPRRLCRHVGLSQGSLGLAGRKEERGNEAAQGNAEAGKDQLYPGKCIEGLDGAPGWVGE